jgi:hypothetical protein
VGPLSDGVRSRVFDEADQQFAAARAELKTPPGE